MENLLQLIYRNKINFSFEDLLKKDEAVNNHEKNQQILATEIYEVKMI